MTDSDPLITSEQVEAFARDGYVLLPGVLQPTWLASLDGACERILSSPHVRDVTAEAIRLSASDGSGTSHGTIPAARGRFLVSLNTAWRDQEVLEFALLGRMGFIAAALLRSATARFCDDVLLVKEPLSEEETEWHDDEPFSLATGSHRCSLWVSLDDVTEESGALRYLRSSHRNFAGWRARGLDAASLAAAHGSDVVACPVRRGDVVAHHPGIIHSAGPNRSWRRRRAFALRFAGNEARFILPLIRNEPRSWYELQDGEPLGGPRFPLAWPPERS